MKKIIHSLFLIPLLSACAPINTQFSCNVTAGDRCLSIEEVNAMTEMKEPSRLEKEIPTVTKKYTCRGCHTSSDTQTIWVAPWMDKSGHVHTNDTLFAKL